MKFSNLLTLFSTFFIVLLSPSAQAWWAGGHTLIARTAVHALPKTIPEFFRNSEEEIAHAANDPDIAKISNSYAVKAREEPAHFIDLEHLKDNVLPASWEDYQKLITEKKIDLQQIGFVPYSIMEWTERLMICFAEHRKFPRSRNVRMKCAFYAGILAHYVGDLHQPLHTTIHHDGKVTDPKVQAKTGIHALVDGILEKLKLQPAQIRKSMGKLEVYPDLSQGVLIELLQSHAKVDSVYAIESLFRNYSGAPDKADQKLQEWAVERASAASTMLARLYLTAWENSSKTTLPNWVIKR